jgi:hypothetical protein
MSMGYCRLGLAVVATLSLFITAKPESASAVVLAMLHADAFALPDSALTGPRLSVHFRKTQSYYCYPRNYWWFYRPYTTAQDGHARCMPYFHYLAPYGQSGAKPDRSIK